MTSVKKIRSLNKKIQGVSRNGVTLKMLYILKGISFFDTDFFQDYRIRHELSESDKNFTQNLNIFIQNKHFFISPLFFVIVVLK